EEAEEDEPLFEIPRPEPQPDEGVEALPGEEQEGEEELVPQAERPFQAVLFSLSGQDPVSVQAAADLVIQSRRASVTFLQRRLCVGYDEALLLLDALRQEGVVGGESGSPSGPVLLDQEAWNSDD